MAAVLIFVISLFVAVKTAFYGIWEAKRDNSRGAAFVLMLAVICIALAGRYLIKYRA